MQVNFITRPFSLDMSTQTVLALSAEWHDATASADSGNFAPFPSAWIPQSQLDGFDIVPIENGADLYREGKRMHHCVATMADEGEFGAKCFYRIEKAGEPVATASIVIRETKFAIDQVRGPCNAHVPGIERLVKRWLKKWPVPEPSKLDCPSVLTPRLQGPVGDLVDWDIPF